MGRHIPNIQPLRLEYETKESEVRKADAEYGLVLARLEKLPVSEETSDLFHRYVTGELTVTELSEAIDRYLGREKG